MPQPTPKFEKPLFYPDDNPLIYELIKELIDRKRFVSRPSKFHIKHRAINYYPTTGKITIDERGGHPEAGPDAFLALVEQEYPKRSLRDVGADVRDAENHPEGLVLCITLDDEDDQDSGEDGNDNAPPW